jgi:DNA ligase-1
MLLSEIVVTSARVGATRSRSQKIGLLADWLRRLSPLEIVAGVGYLSGRLPQGRIGVGPALLTELRGAGAAEQPTLTVLEVDAALTDIASASGAGSTATRRARLGTLFSRATAAEHALLARLMLGELRQGALEGLMAEAIAVATALPADAVRRALMHAGDLAPVAAAALEEGASGLRRFRLRLLQPVRPMLADSAADVGEALSVLGEAALEYKLDGARVQVHRDDGEVRVFTRALNDVTDAAPELVEAVHAIPARRLVLDGEALVLAPGGRPLPFQVTMRRFGRRLDVAALRETLPLTAFFFDCLHLDGDDLIDRPAAERFAALAATVRPALVIPRRVTDDSREAAAFLDQALAHGHEGVMAKALGAPYEAGNRGATWLKIKPAHTLDLVVLAAEWGHGRRRGYLSNLHLGARDPAGGRFVMLGKTFKGMTDEMLARQTAALETLAVARDAYTVHVRPELVVEVAFSDVQASPHYPGGLALRFARVKRLRPDKSAADADTIDTVRAIHETGHRLVGTGAAR